MKSRKKIHNKGFTLIELLISMAILGFLIYVITAMLLIIVSTATKSNQRSHLRTTMQTLLDNITNDVQFASGLIPCSDYNFPNAGGKFAAGSCITFNINTLTNSNKTSSTSQTQSEYLYTCYLNGNILTYTAQNDPLNPSTMICKTVIINSNPNTYGMNDDIDVVVNTSSSNGPLSVVENNLSVSLTGNLKNFKGLVPLPVNVIIQTNK